MPKMRVRSFLPSTTVNQLIKIGIAEISTELHVYSRQNLHLAGRIKHFKENWAQDPWILDAVQGYRVPFYPTALPDQPSNRVTTLSGGRGHADGRDPEHVRKRVYRGGITHRDAWASCLSTIFPVSKNGRGQRPVVNPKSLNNLCTQYTSRRNDILFKVLPAHQSPWLSFAPKWEMGLTRAERVP